MTHNEFLIYKGIHLNDNANLYNFAFIRIALDINLTYQNEFENVSNLPLSKEVSMILEKPENSINFSVMKNIFEKRIIRGISKHKYSSSIHSIFIYNCKNPFFIMEKKGELFFHPLSIMQKNENYFIPGFATFIDCESENSTLPKGCLFLMNNNNSSIKNIMQVENSNYSIAFAKSNFNEFFENNKIHLHNQNEFTEITHKNNDSDFFENRSQIPFMRKVFINCVVEKIGKIKNNGRFFVVAGAYRLGERNSTKRKYEIILMDAE